MAQLLSYIFLIAATLACVEVVTAFPCDYCPKIHKPVCGSNGRTYPNMCEAICRGVRPKYIGECNCICPAVHLPVCGADGVMYSNICFATCVGVKPCTAENGPVCGEDGKTYSSRCFAGCLGVKIKHKGECEDPCICTEEYSPVCGVDGVTYPNRCHADCASCTRRPL